MREEQPNWFARREEELPTPEELMPLSQTLITPDLALAFDIPTSPTNPNNPSHHQHPQQSTPTPSQSHHHHHLYHHPEQQSLSPSSSHHHHQQQQQPDFDSSELGGGGWSGAVDGPGDEPARTLKRPRLVWTTQLHKRFVDAVAHLGIKNAVPKTIMQLMSVDGLTRENVASHLQKYRLYLKRMQGLSSGAGPAGGPISAADAATDHLFASSPVPQHFLNCALPPVVPGVGAGGSRTGPEQFMPFVPVSALQHQQQMAAVAAAAHQQQQYYHHRHMGHIGSPPSGGFDHGYLTRQHPQQSGLHRMVCSGGMGVAPSPPAGSYVEDLESGGTGGGGRKVLTLFPTGMEVVAVSSSSSSSSSVLVMIVAAATVSLVVAAPVLAI